MTNNSVNATSGAEKAAPNGSSATGIRLSNGRLRDEYYEPLSPDHFAPKSGDQILDIGIIGAGIAGLAAAAALVQSGHNVDVSPDNRIKPLSVAFSYSFRYTRDRNSQTR